MNPTPQPSVVFDHTRVMSALGQSEAPPHLILSNLAKLVEAVVLYDHVYTTEVYRRHESDYQWAKGFAGFFDLEKTYIYEPLFARIFQPLSSQVQDRLPDPPRADYRGLSFPVADIAVLDEARKVVSRDDFQFLSGNWPGHTMWDYDQKILSSLERTRVLTCLAGDIGVPYDPVQFRVPLLTLSIPGNLSRDHLVPYRQFENEVRSYITELLGDRLGFEFPLMLAIVLRECRSGSPDDLFANALQLRHDPMFVRFRELLAEHLNAYRQLDLKTVATTNRIVKSEIAQLKVALSSETSADFKLNLKPSWFPLAAGWDLRSAFQHFRDRKYRVPVANLSRLTVDALYSLGAVRDKIESLLPIQLPHSGPG